MLRWLKRHFYRRPRALPRWWRSPDRYLLRYETRWALRWLRRPAGIFWLIFPIGYGVLAKLYIHRSGIFFVGLFALWLWLVQTRTFAVNSEQRLHDFAMSRFKPHHFWPALLMAPILITMIVFSIYWGVFVFPIIVELAIKVLFFDQGVMHAMTMFSLGCLTLAAFIFYMIFVFQFVAAATAHVSSRCRKNPSIVSLLISCLGLLIALYLRLLLAILLLITVWAACGHLYFDRHPSMVPVVITPVAVLALVAILQYLSRVHSKAIIDLRSVEFSEIYRERLEGTEDHGR